jgi:predicted nucleotidyltransferase
MSLREVLPRSVWPLDMAARLRLVFVYGSIASGQEQSDSGIDLMVVGKVATAIPPTKGELDNLRSIVTRSLNDVTAPGLTAQRVSRKLPSRRSYSTEPLRRRGSISISISISFTLPFQYST